MKTTTTFTTLLILLSAGISTADATLTTVALTGDTAPGTSDSFTFFGIPVLNNAGQTAFVGDLDGSFFTDSGIWSEGGGSGLALVTRKGNAAPGTTGTSDNFRGFDDPLLNNAGQTAFRGTLNSGFATDSGIWSEGGGSGLALVAREGDPAPGTSDNFIGLIGTPALNDAGQTAFLGGINSSNTTNRGIWSEGGGSGLALVAREGIGTAPGTGSNFTTFASPVINDAGQTAFLGGVNSGGPTSRGIWSEGGGSGLALVARAGNMAPGTSDNFTVFNSPVLNDAGQTAFLGHLNTGNNTTNRGIWSEGGGSGLALVARLGDAAPGTSDSFTFLGTPVLNDVGQTAFLGDLNSGNNTTGSGIWAEDPSGVLTLIARQGDLLDVENGPGTDFRTIIDLSFVTITNSGFSNTGNGDGRASGFNNFGQLAFRANFTDGTSGVFLSNLAAVPSPRAVLRLDVIFTDPPEIAEGDFPFGFSEFPEEIPVSFLLGEGTTDGSGTTRFGIDDVISPNFVFGDGVFTSLDEFDVEMRADGTIESLFWRFNPITTPSISNGVVIMNSPLFIRGTDIATGEAFSYSYATSTETITFIPEPATFSILCLAGLIATWYRRRQPN